ncbi:MAG: YidH family protein [Ktedonobacterales bacterium]
MSLSRSPAAEESLKSLDTVRDHLANERTLLAWSRTSIALVGLGFEVARFALDVTSLTALSTAFGMGLVMLGGGLLAMTSASTCEWARPSSDETFGGHHGWASRWPRCLRSARSSCASTLFSRLDGAEGG